nr:MAG TPA: hypothetical protein [Caudoviricetes sp.]
MLCLKQFLRNYMKKMHQVANLYAATRQVGNLCC